MNIYITGLSYDVDDADLRTLFEEYGNVSSAKVIIDRLTGKSKGFGFVEVDNEMGAKKAILELNGATYDGKKIAVSEARPKTEMNSRRPSNNNKGAYGGSSSGGGRNNRY